MRTRLFSVMLLGLAGVALTACGGGGGGGGGGSGQPPTGDVCDEAVGVQINRDALMQKNCPRLSDYNLFADAANPTADAHGGGLRYELTTPLFTDYTSKYRFVFLPEGENATYVDTEVFDFPVGTVITKTFSLPSDTAHRGFENETLLETRLLIHRESGWVALPYVWNETHTEAVLKVAGGPIPSTVVHNGEQLDFTYRVPDTNQCLQCHQKSDGEGGRFMSLIGPKARLLNRDVNYGNGPESQLQAWIDAGMLTGAPADLNSIDTIPAYNDENVADIAGMTSQQLHQAAKGYLDINCAHCHRPIGGASNTGLRLEYDREFVGHETEHGVCKRPIAYGGGSLSFDIVPGDAEQSILHFRMASAAPGDRMPEIGRALVHEEGVALIEAWINDMTPQTCVP